MKIKVHKIAITTCLMFLAFALPAMAQTHKVIKFDTNTPGNFANLTTYGGLIWTNTATLDAIAFASGGDSGYTEGLISTNNVAYPQDSSSASGFSTKAGHTMIVKNAYITSAWNNNMQIEIQGYKHGILLYDNFVVLSATQPTLVQFPNKKVNKVIFITSGGTNYGYGGSGEYYALDNLNLTIY